MGGWVGNNYSKKEKKDMEKFINLNKDFKQNKKDSKQYIKNYEILGNYYDIILDKDLKRFEIWSCEYENDNLIKTENLKITDYNYLEMKMIEILNFIVKYTLERREI